MLGLPSSTELRKPLPKSQLYKKFDLKASQRASFDKDVASMVIINAIMPQTLPAISEGNEVKAIFVIEVELKRKDYDPKSLYLIAKLIPQRIVFALRYEDNVQLAVYHDKRFTAPWQAGDDISLPLSGLNLDSVWGNIVSSIGNFTVEENKSLSEQIKVDEERAKLIRQIEALERQMNATKQPRRKRELFVELQKLKSRRQ